MKRAAALLICWVLLTSAFSAWAGELSPDQRAEADDFFAALFSGAKAVGGAVIVNQGGERLYDFFYGRTGRGASVTEDTVYKVASLTKMITAMGVMQLVEEGKLALDAPLAHGDTPIRNPRFPDAPITLRQVMSHTSSIAPTANYTTTPRWNETYFDEKHAPGTHYAYANLNGGMLGSLIERASGQSLNAYMQEHLFAPLGINAAYSAVLLPDSSQLSYSFTPEHTVKNSASSYLKVDAADYEDTCDPDRHFRASVGGLYISLKGMETLAAVLAGNGQYQGVRVLSPLSVRTMRQDQSTLPGSSVTGKSPYGLNTYRFELDGRRWYGHQGWWDGRLTDLFYEPETGTGVVLVMNGIHHRPGTVDAAVAARMEWTLQYAARWLGPAVDDLLVVEDEE